MAKSTFNEGDVAGAISSYFGVAPGASGVSDLLRVIMPDVKLAAKSDPSSWKAVVPTVIAKYESMARELGLGPSQVDRELHTIRHSNASDANHAAAFKRLEGLLGPSGARIAASAANGGSSSEGRRSSTDFAVAFNGGPYNAGNLSSDLKALINASAGITGRDVASAANFTSGLGLNAHQYTGYFVGSSATVRTAIQSHITNGSKLTNDQLTNSADATAVMGAIKAGKIKRKDAPSAVQKIMDDMEKQGIDPASADPKTLQKYFADNPQALDIAKRENAKAIEADAGLTAEQKAAKNKAAQDASTAAQKTKPKAKEKTSGLGL